MTVKTKALLFASAGLILIAIFALSTAYVRANPAYFLYGTPTATATTSLTYMTPGRATTTLELLRGATTQAFNGATVTLQVTATSTGVAGQVLLNARLEGSYDLIDWYPIAIPANTATTSLYTTNPYNSFQLALATSTSPAGNFGGTGSASKMMESFDIDTSLPNIRVVLTNPVGGGNYGVWAQIIGKRETY